MPNVQYKALDTNTNLESIPNNLVRLIGSRSSFLTSQNSVNFLYKVITDKPLKLKTSKNNLFFKKSKNLSECLLYLLRMDTKIKFYKIESDLFYKNLLLIDSDLPEITAHLLLKKYLTKESSLDTLTELVEESNPLHYPIDTFYRYKIKRMLRDMIFCMSSQLTWNEKFDTTGITLAIRNSRGTTHYLVYDIQKLLNYLIKNIYLGTPETADNFDYSQRKKEKHSWSWLYEENEELFIKLSFQLRFPN